MSGWLGIGTGWLWWQDDVNRLGAISCGLRNERQLKKEREARKEKKKEKKGASIAPQAYYKETNKTRTGQGRAEKREEREKRVNTQATDGQKREEREKEKKNRRRKRRKKKAIERGPTPQKRLQAVLVKRNKRTVSSGTKLQAG